MVEWTAALNERVGGEGTKAQKDVSVETKGDVVQKKWGRA